MAVSPFKTFSAGEVLTASDLNASFTQITDNGEDLAWPATKAKDLNGNKLILDADADTSITADTDDQIDIMIAAADDFRFTTNLFSVLTGSQMELPNGTAAAPALRAAGDTDIGLFFGASVIGFSMAGAEVGRISSGKSWKFGPSQQTTDANTAHEMNVTGDGSLITQFYNTAATTPFGIGVTFNGGSPDNNTQYFISCSDSTTTRMRVYSDGDLQNHDNSYGAISDLALKQDVEYIGPYAGQAQAPGDGSYAALMKKFRPAKYRFKTDVAADENAGYQLGLIAQDVKEFAPGLVQGEGTEEAPYSLQYSLIAMQMVVAMQEVIQRLEALEAA